jgi:hypothetical protein
MTMTIIKQKLNNREKQKIIKIFFHLFGPSTHVYSKTIFLIEKNQRTILQNI